MGNINLNFQNYKRVNIYDIADVERAIKGKIYPAGCTLIPLSAAISTPNRMTTEAGEIESRWAVVQPKDNVNSVYLFAIIGREYPHFKAKFMTTINLQFGQLKNLEVDYHPDKSIQNTIAEMLERVEDLAEKERRIVETLKEQKKYYLGTMFA